MKGGGQRNFLIEVGWHFKGFKLLGNGLLAKKLMDNQQW
jgi:hypothetical protein